MKLRKIWGAMVAAVAIGVVVTVLFGTGILAKNDDQPKDNDHEKGQNSLFVYADTVAGGATGGCLINNLMHPGDTVVWRIKVLDENGKAIDTAKLKSVVVKLEDGQIIPTIPAAKYGLHDKIVPPDSFWSTAWTIPADYKHTGSLPYEVVATALDGKHTGKFDDFRSLLIVLPKS